MRVRFPTLWGGVLVGIVLLGSCSLYAPGSGKAEPTAVETTKAQITVSSNPSAVPAESSAPVTAAPTKDPSPTTGTSGGSAFYPGKSIAPGCYAVLRGEGAYYNIYDDQGRFLSEGIFTIGESWEPVGVLTQGEIGDFFDPYATPTKRADPSLQESRTTAFPGGSIVYLGDEASGLRVYNRNGEPILFGSAKHGYLIYDKDTRGDDTAVFVREMEYSENYTTSVSNLSAILVDRSGQVLFRCRFAQLQFEPVQILSEKYIIQNDSSDMDNPHYSVFDSYGNPVVTDVKPIAYGYYGSGTEGSMSVRLYGYYMKDGVIYDASLSPVPNNSLAADGDLIPGMNYDVDGISCLATTDSYVLPGADIRVVATGSDGARFAIRTKNHTSVITGDGISYCGSNENCVLLKGQTTKMYSLSDGRMLAEISGDYMIAPQYVIASTWDAASRQGTFRIIDADGKTRYQSDKDGASITEGDFFLLTRGSYTGIADLDGNWIIRTLRWELTRDALFPTPTE